MAKACYRHFGCRVTDQLIYKGMRTLFMENESLRIGILLDKGADIFEFLHKPTDTDFLWRSPQGIVEPARYRETIASGSGSFLDHYHGGWQEILPGGGPTVYRGAELGLHGEVAHLGWDFDILTDTPECVEVRLQVACIRTPLKIEKKLRLEKGKPVLFMEEKVSNQSSEAFEFMWGHHPAIGAPFLKEGVRLFVPAGKAEVHDPRFAESGILEPGMAFDWPHVTVGGKTVDFSLVPGPEAGYSELLYLKDLSQGWYAVLDPKERLGLGFVWPKEVFPYLWFWLVYGRAPGYPWWDRVYCIALEPWTSIPNSLPKAMERGSHTVLKGGESLTVQFNTVAITGLEEVKGIEMDGKVY